MPHELLDLGAEGSRLRVTAQPHESLAITSMPDPDEGWLDVTFTCDAAPFGGTLETTMVRGQIAAWRDALAGFDAPGRLVLGGDRAVQLTLEVEPQIPDSGVWAVEVTLVPSGDDPWPLLRYLIHDVDPGFTEVAADAARTLVDITAPSG